MFRITKTIFSCCNSYLDDERKDAYYPEEEKGLSWPQVLN